MIKTNKPIIPKHVIANDGRRQDHIIRSIVWRKKFRMNLEIVKPKIKEWLGAGKLQSIEFINEKHFMVRKRMNSASYSIFGKFTIN